MTSITIPDSVRVIGDYSFYECGLNNVFYTGTRDDWFRIDIYSYNDSLRGATKIYNSDGIERTYSFVTNCEQTVDSQTAYNLSELPELKRDGYALLGWYDTIAFETNGGSPVAQIEAEAGDEITVPAAPTKSGERFVGWYESTDGGTTLKPDAFVFGYMPSKNITLYAKWQDAVIGSWETYQVVMPAGTVINLGEEFTFLGTTLSEDLFNLTVEETSLTLTMTKGESTMSDSATYTKTDGVYVATLTIMGGTVYTLTTYDEENDRLFCEIRDKEGEDYTVYYRLTLTRVPDEA